LSPFSEEAANPDEEVSEFSAWAMSHMGKASSSVSFDSAAPPEAYSDPTVYVKVQEYTSAVYGSSTSQITTCALSPLMQRPS
jgi:hypothetical protein